MAVVLLIGGGAVAAACIGEEVRHVSRKTADSQQLKQVHAGILAAQADLSGSFPLPSELERDPVTHHPDERLNDHATMWGILVARGFVDPELLVSPGERNRAVQPYRPSGKAHDPAAGRAREIGANAFQVDLSKRSNCSYAAMPLDPTARRRQACSAADGACSPTVGNRGPRGGALTDPQTGEVTSRTVTNVATEGPIWRGCVIMSDNHCDWLTISPGSGQGLLGREPCPGGPPSTGDELFRNDDGCRADPSEILDFWLIVQRASANDRPDGHDHIREWDGGRFASWD
ncbi:MAG: hypothetical protein U0625_13660 [Phycisphaerales bacterium]